MRDQPPKWAIAIAASAGGIPALIELLGALPPDLPAAILVVQHLDPRRLHTQLPDILDRRTPLRVAQARDGMQLTAGRVYIAPPNQHLVVKNARFIGLSDAPVVHFVRPAADVLFPTVAERFGSHAIAVVLSGAGRDGAVGTEAVHRAGGIVIVQDEATSQHFGMPGAAIAQGHADHVLPIEHIAGQIMSLTGMNGGN